MGYVKKKLEIDKDDIGDWNQQPVFATASTNSITISTELEESVIIERRYKTILV